MKKLHLQGIGEQNATEAQNVKVGDVLIWNYGMTETVTSIKQTKSGKMLYFGITCPSGYTGTRRINRDRLVAVQGL